MVVRAYAFRAFIPGIIVDQVPERIESDPDEITTFEPYNEWNFIVAWSDGSISREMDVELDDLVDALEWDAGGEQ
jgi:hypothetical protein